MARIIVDNVPGLKGEMELSANIHPGCVNIECWQYGESHETNDDCPEEEEYRIKGNTEIEFGPEEVKQLLLCLKSIDSSPHAPDNLLKGDKITYRLGYLAVKFHDDNIIIETWNVSPESDNQVVILGNDVCRSLPLGPCPELPVLREIEELPKSLAVGHSTKLALSASNVSILSNQLEICLAMARQLT